jgi:Rrf2 family protein
MLSSSRFIVAVHAMSLLARTPDGKPVCSTLIASSVQTNPVVIRRMMSALEKSGLVQSVAGRAGGFVLARKASTISLGDIYHAVENDAVFRLHKTDVAAKCPVAQQMGKVLAPYLKKAEQALTATLADTNLKQVVEGFV